MENKVDLDKLELNINDLTSLKNHWSGKTQISNAAGKNSGAAVSQFIDIEKTVQDLQNEFITLIGNTVTYMQQRKNSIQSKENTATEAITK